jgi:hypothetical protein
MIEAKIMEQIKNLGGFRRSPGDVMIVTNYISNCRQPLILHDLLLVAKL